MIDNTINPTKVQLDEEHRRILENIFGIAPEIIQQRGYRTVSDKKILKGFGFTPKQCRVPGLLIPIYMTNSHPSNLYIFSPDDPRENTNKKNSRESVSDEFVYNEIPEGMGVRLDCPLVCHKMLKDPNDTLWVTDHPQKSDSLASRGICAITLLGIWGFKGKNTLGGTVFLADWEYITLDHRKVNIIYDSDALTNPGIQKAMKRLSEYLKHKGAKVNDICLPSDPSKGCFGVDEWLTAGHTVEELEKLVKAPQPALKPADPVVTIIEGELLEMARPLSLVNGKAYAASWQKVKITKTQGEDKKGNLIQLIPPKIIVEKRLLIVREDGKGFGGSVPVEALGFEVLLVEKPDPDKTWSGAGIKRFKKGDRPIPSDVFNRLIKIIDHFIDFNKSLADQGTMCELIACWVMATWFLDAFNVTGYLWLTGEKGSGKTDLLSLIAELSYLGQFISHTGSFASLRDMADYGATLCFDDAETITYQNDKDQDKRSLLLAGNHRGVKVSLKVPGPDKTWQIKYINAFCPRAFSAIGLPDPVLISRSIIIPLVRTSDKKRSNIDPADYEEWPCERRRLIDDLWAMATHSLSKMPEFDKWVGSNAKLIGRNLQPWRAILTIAKFLEASGMDGFYQKMEEQSVRYQAERPQLEMADMTSLVLEALGECAISAINANCAINNKKMKNFIVKVDEVYKTASSLATDQELDINMDHINNRLIGRVLGKLRFDKASRPGGKGSRLWLIDINHLVRLAEAYNVKLPDDLIKFIQKISDPLLDNGINGTNGSDGSEALQSNSSMPQQNPSIKPETPCYSCGSMDYWQRSDGDWVCNVCHPK